MLIGGTVLVVWSVACGVAVFLSWVCVDRGTRNSQIPGPARAGFLAAAVVLFVAATMHNPLAIHLAQIRRSEEMRLWQGRTLSEFEARYGPPAYGSLPFVSWRTLPWYSPLGWGSVTLAVHDDGRIGAVWIRGFREAFS